MKILDCCLSYGSYRGNAPFQPCPDFSTMLTEARRAGISGGLVFNVAADNGGAAVGTRLLAEDLAANAACDESYFGALTLLPSCTRELPSPQQLPAFMRERRLAAIRINPATHRFLAKPRVLADYLEMAQAQKIPVLFNTGEGLTLEQIEDYMAAFPQLTVILTYTNPWPSDRLLRPFLDYPNLSLNTAYLIADQVIEQIVEQYGANRLVFGSYFPWMYLGANMLHIQHARIRPEEKEQIFSGNLLRMLEGQREANWQ